MFKWFSKCCSCFSSPTAPLARRHISKKIVTQVYHRCRGQCFYCLKVIPQIAPRKGIYEIDHLKAFSKQGADDISNYYIACFKCNKSKGKRELAVFLATKNLTKQCQFLDLQSDTYCMNPCNSLNNLYCSDHTVKFCCC